MKNIDFLSPLPNLYVYKNERYFTKIGITSSIISIILISSATIYLIVSLIYRENVFITQNLISNSLGNLNFNNTILVFNILDKFGNNFNDSQRIYNMVFHYDIYGKYEINSKNSFTTLIRKKLEKCDEVINNSQFLEIPEINNFYCLNLDPGINVYNTFGDLKNGFGYFNVFINKCMNNSLTNNTNCLPKEIINDYLNKAYITLSYFYYNIDHNKQGNPTIEILKSSVLDFSITIFQRIYFNLKKVYYETDNGYLFHSIEKLNFTNIVFKKSYSDFRSYGIYPETISTIIISLDEVSEVYYRSYNKIQNLFGNLGGIMNGIIFIFSYLVKFFTNKANLINLNSFIMSNEDTLLNKNYNLSLSIPPVNLIKINKSNKITNLSDNKQVKNQINIKKEESINLNDLKYYEYILPYICLKANRKIDFIKKTENTIKEYLSIDYIINKIHDLKMITEHITNNTNNNER